MSNDWLATRAHCSTACLQKHMKNFICLLPHITDSDKLHWRAFNLNTGTLLYLTVLYIQVYTVGRNEIYTSRIQYVTRMGSAAFPPGLISLPFVGPRNVRMPRPPALMPGPLNSNAVQCSAVEHVLNMYSTVVRRHRSEPERFKSYAEWARAANSELVGYRVPGTSLQVVVLCSERAIREALADPVLEALPADSLAKLTNPRAFGAATRPVLPLRRLFQFSRSLSPRPMRMSALSVLYSCTLRLQMGAMRH